MLLELRLSNLAVIPRAELVFSDGLNVITGETGAGKTILANAIALILGNRADSALIRPGNDEALVEAVFRVPDGFFNSIPEIVEIAADEDLSVRRLISRDGRSRAYVGGVVVNLSVIGRLTERLLKFSAQHEQRRLMMADQQLEILDAFAGSELLQLRDEYQILYQRRAQILNELEKLDIDAESRRKEAELLKFQVDEIAKASLVPGEDEDLEKERQKLVHAREIQEAAAHAARCLGAGESAEGGFMDELAGALKRLESLEDIHEDIAVLRARLQSCAFELEEIGSDARKCHEAVESDSERLADVEERLDLIASLKRKYGGSVASVIVYAEKSAKQLSMIEGSEGERASRRRELDEVEAEASDLAGKISRLRRDAAVMLAAEAHRHLRELAFRECGFEVRFAEDGKELAAKGNADSLTFSGRDTIEFYISPNPGMPAYAVRETASGGELSRIMLAIKSAVADRRDAATLVFDEIDAGIGGKTGLAVGAKLKKLATVSQLICITHLPQIACFADTHFSVTKKMARKGKETVAEVSRLEGNEVVDELCCMMGSRPNDGDARAHAGSLLKKVGVN